MKALSVRQPWAWLIVNGFKDIENRSWPTAHRGPILIHASLMHADPADVEAVLGRFDWLSRVKLSRQMPALDSLPTGGLIGIVNIVDCVESSTSDWFEGPYGFVLQNAHSVPPVPYPGQRGLFDVEVASVLGLAEALHDHGI